MDTTRVKKQATAITISLILVTSTFTLAGAFPFFTVQEAEAQALQLRVSAAEDPAFGGAFFGSQIVQIVIDDPGATDNDDSTAGLQVKGFTVPRVHLRDGLWYSFIAETNAFGLLLDILTDGTADSRIAQSFDDDDADVDDGGTITIGATTFTMDTNEGTSFVEEISTNGQFVEITPSILFPTLPSPFGGTAGTVNPDLDAIADADAETNADGTCDETDATDLEKADGSGGGSVETDPDCDWPYIRLIELIETDVVAIRAGTASVDIIYDDVPAPPISSGVDRTTDYPVDAEVIVNFKDNMWNMNPVEEDVVTFVLDKDTGVPNRIIYQPTRNFPDATGGNAADGTTDDLTIANADFNDVFVGIDFDGRQVLELDAPEGINSIKYTFVFDVSRGNIGTFVATPSFTATDARDLGGDDFVGENILVNGANAQAAVTADDPAVRMVESDPNTSFFESIDEAEGSKSNVFTALNDKVASWDYFDLISSTAMTQHDGFTTVDAEIYDSADRATFTVTDSDLNLRSRISETKDAQAGKNLLEIGTPIPIINTRKLGSDIFDTTLNNVDRIYEGTALPVGDGAGNFDADADLPGVQDVGVIIRADIDGDGTIDDETGGGNAQGTEAFHIAEDDITALNIDTVTNGTGGVGGNDRVAIIFTAAGFNAGTDFASAIIIDTELSLDDIDDLEVDDRVMTGKELKDQINLDNQEDGTVDSFENWLIQNAKITVKTPASGSGDTAGDIISRSDGDSLAGVNNATTVEVDIPKYNLVQLDTIISKFEKVPTDFVVQIEVVRSSCDNDVIATAFAVDAVDETTKKDRIAEPDDCVIARQIVDFTPFANFAEDNDGDADTGDDYQTNNFGFLDSVMRGPGNDTDVSYDRDASTKRSAIGSFRVLDLVDAAAQAENAPTTANTFIRFEILLIGDNDPKTNDVQTDEPLETLSLASQILTLDILGLNILFDPPQSMGQGSPGEVKMDRPGTFSNMIYRLEIDEAAEDSSIFTASADFETATQFDTVNDVLGFVVTAGDPVKIWMPERFIPPSRLAFTFIDEDIVNFFRSVSATFIYETRDGSVEWDKSSYSFGQDAFITLTDEDLNRRPDATERYNLPIDGFLYFEVADAAVQSLGSGFAVDATLLETGTDTGAFVAQITMGSEVTTVASGTATANVKVQNKDFEVNYVDIRDTSSITFATFSDIANVRTTLGDVVLDRAAYPPGALMFVEIHDNDFNTDVDIRETLDLRQIVTTVEITSTSTAGTGFLVGGATKAEGTTIDATTVTSVIGTTCDELQEFGTQTACGNANPILEINLFQTGTGKTLTLLPAGFLDLAADGASGTDVTTSAGDTRFGTGLTTQETNTPNRNVLPILDRNDRPVIAAQETGPNTGIFEFEVRLPGPQFDAGAFPVTLPKVLQSGTVDSPTITANLPIQVTYSDPADQSGEFEDEEELATILFNTARLRTDKLEYGLGDSVQVILEESDLNLDSRSIDEIEFSVLDVITDKFDTEDVAGKDFGTAVSEGGVSTDLPRLRETDFNTGVFAVIMEDLPESFVDRGEDVELLYQDKTPSGGGASIRIEYEFLVVEILPEIIFDKEEYTPFDEFIISIISPDSNQDPDRIETISVLISSSSASLGKKSIPETGPNTGIFEEDFDLTPNKDQFIGDLVAIREDGVTVEFRIDEDTVATKSVFVNYHVGQIMFDKDAFQINERGVLRVVDPDGNQNPDTIDTLDVRFWSNTDRGGLLVTLRETGDRTGIFEEIISFTPDEESTGTRLRVTEGDVITTKYQDDTLPAPAALSTDKVTTVEIEELFASALIGALIPPLERAIATEPDLVDQTGQALIDVSVGSQVLIQSEITNSQTKKQPFAFIVQIKDDLGATLSLSWVTGEIPAKDSLTAAQSWIPDAAGDYKIEIFVWESVTSPVALSPVRTTTVSVSS